MKKAELGKIKKSVFASLLLVVCNYFVHAQHGVCPAWGPAVPLPKFNSGAKQRGTLYNNQVATSGGRIIYYKLIGLASGI
jgi:hypothetical protein